MQIQQFLKKYINKFKQSKMFLFLLGAVCFIISQPLLRFPILKLIQNTTDFTLAYVLYPQIIGLLIAVSAGVFEEGFRFLFRQFLIKPYECTISQPIIFGLGHGIAEAIIILVPALSLVNISQLGVAFLERFLAIILHVNLTIIVWNGFQREKRVLFLFLAIAVHGSINSLIPLLSSHTNNIILIEGALAAADVILIGYSFYSRKYYTRRKGNEEIKV